MTRWIRAAEGGLGLTGGTGGGLGLAARHCILGDRGGKGLDGGRGFVGSVCEVDDNEDNFFGGCGACLLGVISGAQTCFAVDSIKVGWLI